MIYEVIDHFPQLTDAQVWESVPIIDAFKRDREQIERFLAHAPRCLAVATRQPEHWQLAMEIQAVRFGLAAHNHRGHYFDE